MRPSVPFRVVTTEDYIGRLDVHSGSRPVYIVDKSLIGVYPKTIPEILSGRDFYITPHALAELDDNDVKAGLIEGSILFPEFEMDGQAYREIADFCTARSDRAITLGRVVPVLEDALRSGTLYRDRLRARLSAMQYHPDHTRKEAGVIRQIISQSRRGTVTEFRNFLKGRIATMKKRYSPSEADKETLAAAISMVDHHPDCVAVLCEADAHIGDGVLALWEMDERYRETVVCAEPYA